MRKMDGEPRTRGEKWAAFSQLLLRMFSRIDPKRRRLDINFLGQMWRTTTAATETTTINWATPTKAISYKHQISTAATARTTTNNRRLACRM